MHATPVLRSIRPLCLAAGLLVSAAFASSPARAEDDQVKLTPSRVESFIAAHGELAALAVELTRKYGDRSDTPGEDPVASLPAFQDVAEAKTRTGAILAKYSFKSFDDFDIVTNSVMLAYQADVPDANDGQRGAADSGPGDLEADKAKAKAEIEADASLTSEKKKEALQQLDEQFDSLQSLAPLPGNPEVVKPYLDKLKPIAEAN